MKLLHINSGCTLEVIKSNSKTSICKIVTNPNNIPYLKVGTIQKIGVSDIENL